MNDFFEILISVKAEQAVIQFYKDALHQRNVFGGFGFLIRFDCQDI